MPATSFWLGALSSWAEYQQVESAPIASSPICLSSDSSTAVMLEGALEAGIEFIAVRDIVGEHRDAFIIELLGRVIAHGVAALGGRRGRAHEPRVGLALRHVFGGRDAQGRDALLANVIVDG